MYHMCVWFFLGGCRGKNKNCRGRIVVAGGEAVGKVCAMYTKQLMGV